MSKATYEGKCIAITGGTGSFGRTMTSYLLDAGASEVRILSRDEAKQDSMRLEFANPKLRFYVGDTRDPHVLAGYLRGVNYLFHAAALKQVPTGEFFPLEVTKTNILGSHNVLVEAINQEVESVVCLSTDKAVYPINAMGMSKALMEKTALSLARESAGGKTRISITRYGNVLYSRGSVVPLFVRQLEAGNKLTITNPTMTRFLMSLQESVSLVEYAFMNGKSGDIFVRKAPASSVIDLAKAVALILEEPNPSITVIGTRHGEKLYECLLSAEERRVAFDEGEYFRVPLDTRSLDYALYFESGTLEEFPEAYTSHNTDRLGIQETSQILRTLPEFSGVKN